MNSIKEPFFFSYKYHVMIVAYWFATLRLHQRESLIRREGMKAIKFADLKGIKNLKDRGE